MQKGDKGQKKMKKDYSESRAFASDVRVESVSEKIYGEAQKLEGHTSNGGKPGIFVRSKKISTENDMPREGNLKRKLATSEGNNVFKASVDCRDDCFHFGAITHKIIGNGDTPSAKKSIFKDERVDISKNYIRSESTHFTEAKKNNKNPSILSSGSLRAGNDIPSTTEVYDYMTPPQLMKSFNGSGDVSKSSSIGIEDLTKKSFSGENGMNLKHSKTSITPVPSRRRALRFVVDDDAEESRTPIHRITAATLLREYSGTFDSERTPHMQPKSFRDSPQNTSLPNMSRSFIGNVSSKVDERRNNVTEKMETTESCYSASRTCNVEVNVLKCSADLAAGSNSVKKKRCKTGSPNRRVTNDELETDKLVNLKAPKHHVRGKNPYNAQFGDSCKAFGTSYFSCSPSIPQKHKLSLEKSRAIPKSSISGLIVTENRSNVNFSAECYADKDVSAGQRSDITRDATADSADSKLTDSAMSMKHLIAAAQAKRRQAQSHQLLDGSGTTGSSLTPDCVCGRSPNLISTMQTLPSGEDSFQKDKNLFRTSFPSQSHMTSHQFLPVKQREHEDYNRRPSTGNLHPTDYSSGSTEAAIARDALEGMIETLSRTRESIGRATRHAIDCAKYGIANEVVELLIHKLEDEPSLSHRIDLFFLVDSITQCSHTQKGIAGASYVPVVQAALPRLLGAAAPAGTSAHENRRQCLKVLRLWLERRILPEYFLRRCMDDIEALNVGLNSEFSHRIPSCAEQSMNSPIRETESLLVDQYGSNTAFLFPGILPAHVLEGDEEFSSSPCNVTADCSPHEAGGVSEVLLASEGRPMEAHHHALQHVENEIEMEDALSISPDERSIVPYPEHCWFVESTCSNQNDLLLLPEGSPPLPLDPPPTPPPLPPSPPPPTPPPPSSPPPMPPPQSSATVPSLPLSSDLHGMHLMHQVSYSSHFFQQCGETIHQIPPHSALPALMIPNHPLTSSQMSLDHLSNGNSMCQHHLPQKYSSYTSTFSLGQRTYGADKQWMSHPGDANQDDYDAWNIGGRSPSCSSALVVQDGCCRLNMERTSTSIDFYQPPHYSALSRASLPDDSFPSFTGIDFWRPT